MENINKLEILLKNEMGVAKKNLALAKEEQNEDWEAINRGIIYEVNRIMDFLCVKENPDVRNIPYYTRETYGDMNAVELDIALHNLKINGFVPYLNRFTETQAYSAVNLMGFKI